MNQPHGTEMLLHVVRQMKETALYSCMREVFPHAPKGSYFKVTRYRCWLKSLLKIFYYVKQLAVKMKRPVVLLVLAVAYLSFTEAAAANPSVEDPG
ncbi:hypothetical protein J437_LFUL017253 [Ladona fulva]|uniref:Uncharacterized protein n=1 Tax=Ladona fulva TaxID=123851 RepID=A0A8K0KMW5_LADFU|nr:hypothetical protein J437_LFUL017253 [Ladona fulva]